MSKGSPRGGDYTNMKFGMLTAIKRTKKRTSNGCAVWKFQCDCGNVIESTITKVKRRAWKSCGCVRLGTHYVGMKFGMLTAIKPTGRKYKSNQTIWEFKCDCGNVTEASIHNVKKGHTQSCGCLHSRVVAITSSRHGLSKTRLHRIWAGMKSRCTNPNISSYKNYGGRGIGVCSEWMEFEVFYSWAVVNGYEEHLTIDRIDNDKGYCPQNCRWATDAQQKANKRTTRVAEIGNRRFTMRELSELTGISIKALQSRRQRGKQLIDREQYDALCNRLEKAGA